MTAPRWREGADGRMVPDVPDAEAVADHWFERAMAAMAAFEQGDVRAAAEHSRRAKAALVADAGRRDR